MSRRYDEQIQVMTVARAGDQGKPSAQDTRWGAEPERFLWRGRLYRVREVLSCWRERQPWWTQEAAAAVQGGDESPRTQIDRLAVLADGSERQIWRVRASAGRLAVMGTYDLAHQSSAPESGSSAAAPAAAPIASSSDPAASAASSGQQSRWWLLQVSD